MIIVGLSTACAVGDPVQINLSSADASSSSGGDTGGASSSTGGAPTSSGGAGGDLTSASGAGGTGASGPVCGDGVIDPLEQCDDANTITGDGCAACAIECGAPGVQDPVTGHCFQLFAIAGTQATAEAACQAWGGSADLGHLASMNSASETALVSPMITANTWIGADDLGGAFAWIDGSVFSYENWQSGEPNHPGTEHCMFMDAEAKWHDHECTDTRAAYLCERHGAGTP